MPYLIAIDREIEQNVASKATKVPGGNCTAEYSAGAPLTLGLLVDSAGSLWLLSCQVTKKERHLPG